MKISSVASIILLICVALFSTGCFNHSSSAYDVPDRYNFLGIVEVEEATFSESPSTTLAVSSDDVIARDNFSGNRVKLLWGLITLED